ncbi:NADP oxidoreductase [Gordoniibacillus kamchatkensis]|uniref:NADP oxidoreductase n=1 Tax=Gordoniibacillus kamchatkensis TaxID=1590651 RepID=A0ABR5A9X4_9BACL|nr:NADPH-dependent F420 reductase [Paenibacillus sp. VKM B-2647]KIL37804.1 NADP oxidoreductase [Paenibacillus sp. VKM B-2647]
MKIAIIGSGHIGGTLGQLWATKGHEVMFGSRDPQSDKLQKLLQRAGPNARAASVRDAIAFGEVILLAVPGTEIERVLAEAGDLGNKILINSTILFDGRSASAEVIRLSGSARVVRAFHTVTWEVLANPQYGPVNATIFMNGDDFEAKQTVARLCQDIGLDPIDAGDSSTSTQIETAVGTFWQILSPQFGRDYALRVLRREA